MPRTCASARDKDFEPGSFSPTSTNPTGAGRGDRERAAAHRRRFEDDAGERQRPPESLGDVDRVLALHVDDAQGFDCSMEGVQIGDLVHHVVDREAAGGVDDQDVEVVRQAYSRARADVHWFSFTRMQ